MFITIGATKESPTFVVFGIFTVVFYALSFAVIQFHKLNEKFMKKPDSKGILIGAMYLSDPTGEKSTNYWNGSDMVKFIIEAASFFKKYIVHYLVVAGLANLILYIIYAARQFKSVDLYYFMMILFTAVILPVAVPIFMILTPSIELTGE
jgi:hypothetical protein